MNPVYISTGAFPSRRLPEILDTAEQWGITHVELGSDVAPDPDNIALARARRDRFRFVLHNYFPAPLDPFVLNLGATDAQALERSRAHCRQALELSAEIGAPLFAAHAGFAALPSPGQLGRPLEGAPVGRRDESYARFVDSVGELVVYGQRLGVRFLVENNVVVPYNARGGRNPFLLLAEPEEILSCAVDVGDGFGLLLDVAHLKVSASTLGFDVAQAIRDIADHVHACHVSANEEGLDNNKPFDADAWFLPLLDQRWMTTIEVYNATRSQLEVMAQILARRMAASQDSLQ